jgi:hypothetical protein
VPRKFIGDFSESLRSLGQNLKYVPISLAHRVKNPANEIQRHVLVKKIAHRIDKNLPRLMPTQRLTENIRL